MSSLIAIMSYFDLTSLIDRLHFTPPKDVQIKIYNGVLSEALVIAKDLEKKQLVDVFLSSGGNYCLLSKHLQTTMVEVKVTGFDFLLALNKAQVVSNKVAVLTYQKKIPYLDAILPTLKAQVTHHVFRDLAELEKTIDQLTCQGVSAFIGGSLVMQKTQERGLPGFFIYSRDSVLRALDSAVKIAITKQREMEKAQEIRTILDFVSEGIIATDLHNTVTVFNPSAEKITKLSRDEVLGKKVDKVIPGTRLDFIINSGQPEFNQSQAIGDVKILTNRIPIITKGKVTGTVATFKDFRAVQEAEVRVRQKLYQKGFIAKTCFNDLLGRSNSFLQAKDTAIHYAKSDASILIRGHSGTGKELFAQSIHNESLRSRKPFVAVNCAALPENLLESELFGYEEGAFTGAKKGGKQGLFELAHRGTIFLDEIGEMPMPIQSRLLRVLEAREVLRIGGERIIPIDIRVISATNRNLWDMVEKGQFRQDLYYRLCVLELFLPALVHRKDDIPLLLSSFLTEIRPDIQAEEIQSISNHPRFCSYHWQGNVRELRNFVERIAVLYKPKCNLDKIISSLMPQIIMDQEADQHIIDTLAKMQGNRADAAKALGISRTTLWRRMRNLT